LIAGSAYARRAKTAKAYLLILMRLDEALFHFDLLDATTYAVVLGNGGSEEEANPIRPGAFGFRNQ
jgi:hypothetical protein